jgi:hypothetical protein
MLLSFLAFASCLASPQTAPFTLSVPAFTAYIEPKEQGAEVDEKGISQWTDPKQSVVWYGKLNRIGKLDITVKLSLPEKKKVRYELTVDKIKLQSLTIGKGDQVVDLSFGSVEIGQTGSYHRFALRAIAKAGIALGNVKSLELNGPATEDAEFNLTEHRNAASVHIGYPVPKDTEVEWYYNEVTPRLVPIHTFYMACGFHRGYFGMQVISPTERNVIFSVWDSGSEAIDRSRVSEENRVKLIAKGEGVVSSDFGNEGTGGHSHKVVAWEKGRTYRFLLHAEPVGTTTTYTGYFWMPETKQWEMIASFQAPRDGSYLKGLHSFNENFWGTNGQLQRLAWFGPGWIRTKAGEWKELTTGRFTHDGHGYVNRKDYYLRVVGSRFALSNGGFVGDPIKLGDYRERKATKKTPKIGAFGLP